MLHAKCDPNAWRIMRRIWCICFNNSRSRSLGGCRCTCINVIHRQENANETIEMTPTEGPSAKDPLTTIKSIGSVFLGGDLSLEDSHQSQNIRGLVPIFCTERRGTHFLQTRPSPDSEYCVPWHSDYIAVVVVRCTTLTRSATSITFNIFVSGKNSSSSCTIDKDDTRTCQKS